MIHAPPLTRTLNVSLQMCVERELLCVLKEPLSPHYLKARSRMPTRRVTNSPRISTPRLCCNYPCSHRLQIPVNHMLRSMKVIFSPSWRLLRLAKCPSLLLCFAFVIDLFIFFYFCNSQIKKRWVEKVSTRLLLLFKLLQNSYEWTTTFNKCIFSIVRLKIINTSKIDIFGLGDICTTCHTM